MKMRSFVLLTFTLLVASSDFLVVFISGESLANRWAIVGDPQHLIVDSTYWVTFNISETLTKDNINASFRELDCGLHGRELFPEDGISNVGSAINTTGQGSIHFDFDVNILRDNSNIFSAFSFNGRDAGFKFCLNYMLISNGVIVNNVEFDLTLSMSMESSVGITAVGVDDSSGAYNNSRSQFTFETSYGVVSYICDPAFPSIPLTGVTYSQGSIVSVCVTPHPDSLARSLLLDEILWFSWSRDSTQQNAIENGGPAANLLTHYQCSPGSLYCSFSTVLMADFYVNGEGDQRNLRARIQAANKATSTASDETDGTTRHLASTSVLVEGFGEAKLKFMGNNNGRSLTKDGRGLQDYSSGGDSEEESYIRLSVGIQTVDDEFKLSQATPTSGSSTITGTSIFVLGLLFSMSIFFLV